ncbi:GntR family transcriptional regulator [Plantactinospora sp. KBS50]|uniref:GntR family transcriptional regulator n=1 Tax=Plantactinospora sp. KBS50 TaxID=2024580 RepID=UPI0018E060F3|nr:GntR family transcriptional regulator [Plantactinospora sp. KBS50]
MNTVARDLPALQETVRLPDQSPQRRPQLNDEAASYVRELILTGQLQPGEFIRMDRIARDLRISTTPVREGLLALRGEGFVQLEQRRGFTVAPLSPSDIQDVFAAQAVLAGELAARAAQRISAEQTNELQRLQQTLVDAVEQGQTARVEALNHDFHWMINHIADAPKIAWLLSVGGRYVPRRFYATIAGWPQASAEDHATVLTALTRNDAEASREAMAQHMLHAGDLLAGHLSQLRQALDTSRNTG